VVRQALRARQFPGRTPLGVPSAGVRERGTASGVGVFSTFEFNVSAASYAMTQNNRNRSLVRRTERRHSRRSEQQTHRPPPLSAYGVTQADLERLQELRAQRKELKALRARLRFALDQDPNDVEPGPLKVKVQVVRQKRVSRAGLGHVLGVQGAASVMDRLPESVQQQLILTESRRRRTSLFHEERER